MNEQQQFQVAYKQNGHIKKIRKKALKQLRDQLLKEITSYLKPFLTQYQQIEPHQFQPFQAAKCKQHKAKQKLPILNINIRPLSLYEQQPKQQSQSPQHFLTQHEDSQSLQLLQDEIELFKSQQDIKTFIQTQKNIASNIEDSLTGLLQNALQISWNLLKQNKSNISFLYKDPSQMHQRSKAQQDSSQTMIIKENLQQIEDKCLETLNKIKEQRRKLQLCAICLCSKSNTLLLPCMHLGTCAQCSKMITKCPFCKSLIYDRKNVYQ